MRLLHCMLVMRSRQHGDDDADSMALKFTRWMEEYARRLSEGWYGGCESDSSVKGPLEDAGVWL